MKPYTQLMENFPEESAADAKVKEWLEMAIRYYEKPEKIDLIDSCKPMNGSDFHKLSKVDIMSRLEKLDNPVKSQIADSIISTRELMNKPNAVANILGRVRRQGDKKEADNGGGQEQ